MTGRTAFSAKQASGASSRQSPLPSTDSATLRQANQFGHGSHPHLLHHPGTMDFDRLLDGTEVAGDLFVQFASDDIFEHFALTRCERGQARPDFRKFGLLPPKSLVFLNRYTNGCKQVFIVHRLGEEITGALFHRLDALWNVTFTGQKNNGQGTARFGEKSLKFRPLRAGMARSRTRQPAMSGSYCVRNSSADANAATAKPADTQQTRDGAPYRRVIVHNKHGWSGRSSHRFMSPWLVSYWLLGYLWSTCGKAEVECRAAVCVVCRPEFSSMRGNDGTTDRKAQPHSLCFSW